jgi:hypothetical protein
VARMSLLLVMAFSPKFLARGKLPQLARRPVRVECRARG